MKDRVLEVCLIEDTAREVRIGKIQTLKGGVLKRDNAELCPHARGAPFEPLWRPPVIVHGLVCSGYRVVLVRDEPSSIMFAEAHGEAKFEIDLLAAA